MNGRTRFASLQGFSLVELMLAMVVVVMLGLSVTTSVQDVRSASLGGAIWKMQSDIRYAQQLANITHSNVGVLFVQNGSYTVYRQFPTYPVWDPLTHNQMVIDMSEFGPVHLDNSYQVEFDYMGRPTVGGDGHVLVRSNDGQQARRIQVIQVTGATIIDP